MVLARNYIDVCFYALRNSGVLFTRVAYRPGGETMTELSIAEQCAFDEACYRALREAQEHDQNKGQAVVVLGKLPYRVCVELMSLESEIGS